MTSGRLFDAADNPIGGSSLRMLGLFQGERKPAGRRPSTLIHRYIRMRLCRPVPAATSGGRRTRTRPPRGSLPPRPGRARLPPVPFPTCGQQAFTLALCTWVNGLARGFRGLRKDPDAAPTPGYNTLFMRYFFTSINFQPVCLETTDGAPSAPMPTVCSQTYPQFLLASPESLRGKAVAGTLQHQVQGMAPIALKPAFRP